MYLLKYYFMDSVLTFNQIFFEIYFLYIYDEIQINFIF